MLHRLFSFAGMVITCGALWLKDFGDGLRVLPIFTCGKLQWKVGMDWNASFRVLLKLAASASLVEHARACTQRCILNKTVPHPEVESVPRLFLRVDAVGLGPADSPDVGLMALFEVDELEEDERIVFKIHVTSCIFLFDVRATLYLISHLWNKR